MHNEDLFIGAAEASQVLNRNRSTVTRMVERGELNPVSKLPGLRGAFFFNRADIEALLATPVAAVPDPGSNGGSPSRPQTV